MFLQKLGILLWCDPPISLHTSIILQFRTKIMPKPCWKIVNNATVLVNVVFFGYPPPKNLVPEGANFGTLLNKAGVLILGGKYWVLFTKAVAGGWQATVETIAATRPEREYFLPCARGACIGVIS